MWRRSISHTENNTPRAFAPVAIAAASTTLPSSRRGATFAPRRQLARAPKRARSKIGCAMARTTRSHAAGTFTVVGTERAVVRLGECGDRGDESSSGTAARTAWTSAPKRPPRGVRGAIAVDPLERHRDASTRGRIGVGSTAAPAGLADERPQAPRGGPELRSGARRAQARPRLRDQTTGMPGAGNFTHIASTSRRTASTVA